MAGTLGSGSVDYTPDRPILHFGSPIGSTYTRPEPAQSPESVGVIGSEAMKPPIL